MGKELPIEIKLFTELLERGRTLGDEGKLSSGALVRLVRIGLGMSQRQLARRASLPQSTISRIEKGVVRPNETTLQKIFAAMECDIAFIPVPRFKSVADLLKKRAEKVAEKRLRYLEGTMALEQQQPEKSWRKKLLESEIELILQSPSELWDENAD